MQSRGLRKHKSNNKLRDVDDFYSQNGHEFSYNREILYSFDVCGNCEAHGILLAIQHKLQHQYNINSDVREVTVDNAFVLKEIPTKYITNNINFINCPQG